jgi:hypothetical protein
MRQNISVGKCYGKNPFGRTRRKWKYNIRMDLRKIGLKGVDWMPLAQDRNQCRAIVNTVIKHGIP